MARERPCDNRWQSASRFERVDRPFRVAAIASMAGLLVAHTFLAVGLAHYERLHPGLADAPRVTHTKKGIPGDPLNVAFVGSIEELHLSLLSAGWFPADPITLKSSLKIAAGTVFHRPYVDAPVSNLMLWDRRQDLAFEQPVGRDPRRRHHVRFWRSGKLDKSGRSLWIGAATFDNRVGFSRTAGPITHHIAPDVDTERDKLMSDVRRSGNLVDFYWVDDFQEKRKGKNGGGDPYHTDGRLAVGVLATRNQFGTALQVPARMRAK